MNRTVFECCLRVLSPLHVGSGATSQDSAAEDDGETALTAIDTFGNVWMPGSTLKGLLKRHASDLANELFGIAHKENEKLGKGAVTFFGATSDQPPKKETNTQTSVDRGTGASKANALYKRQVVEVGTCFKFKAVITTRSTVQDTHVPTHEKRVDAFRRLLGIFALEDGISVGRNKSDSFGRLKLDGTLKQTNYLWGASGWEQGASPEPAEVEPLGEEKSLHELRLFCEGPYHSFGKKVQTGTSQLDLPKRINGDPALDPSGISGALRTRAEWLLKKISGEYELKEVATTSGPKQWCVVKRLFGDEGRRGSLNVSAKYVNSGTPLRLTSVSIDRFSQASFEGALFTVESDTSVTFNLSIRKFRELSDDEMKFLKLLVEDIKANGISLGKKTTSGYGWFYVDVNDDLKQVSFKPAATNAANRDDVILAEYRRLKARNDRLPLASVARLMGIDASELQKLVDAIDEVESDIPADPTPSPLVTLPYRHIYVDTSTFTGPEESVLQAWKDHKLHSEPLPDALCGRLALSWQFIRPMLVSQGSGRQIQINNRYVIPGSTIRGRIRSLLEATTNAKLNRISPPGSGQKPGKRQWEKNLGSDYPKSLHRRNLPYDDFEPDFVEALFGFVHQVEGEDMKKSEHNKFHLKSRLSFGFAFMDMSSTAKEREERTIKMNGPNPSSKIYDQLGWKTYPIDGDVANAELVEWWAEEQRGNKGSPNSTSYRLLDATKSKPLEFAGEIRFHNITPVELGALLWAVTLDGSDKRYHKIGYAKPFGAGVCQARDLRMAIEGQSGPFDGTPYLEAFREFTKDEEGNLRQSYKEVLASATPGAAGKLNRYQTWDANHGGIENDAKKMVVHNNGPITAMLKRP